MRRAESEVAEVVENFKGEDGGERNQEWEGALLTRRAKEQRSKARDGRNVETS